MIPGTVHSSSDGIVLNCEEDGLSVCRIICGLTANGVLSSIGLPA
jgi:hypothetical protein